MWRTPVPETRFGSVRFRILRESGIAVYGLPDWTPRRRIVTRVVPGGGVRRQDVGADPSQLTLTLELIDGTDVQALWAKIGTTDTLTLRDGIGSLLGRYESILGEGYRHFDDVTLAGIAPIGQAIDGSFRLQATFEADAA